MIEIDPLIVACPRCGAQPISTDLPDGERCKTRSGRPDNPHRGRVEAAEAAAQQKEPTMPEETVPTFDAASAGITPPPDWNPAAPSATTVGAATSDLTLNPPAAPPEPASEQDQQERLPTDPALRKAALRARSATATPDEDTEQHAQHVELDVDRLTDEQVDRLANVIAERIAATAETYTAELISPAAPGRMLGATVWFRSRTGRWTAPAIVTATLDSLYQPNVDAGHLPPLSDGAAVHLTVLTPGIQGHVSAETAESNPELVADDRPNKPAGGTFQEWDVQWWDPGEEMELDPATFAFEQQPAGTWMWPL